MQTHSKYDQNWVSLTHMTLVEEEDNALTKLAFYYANTHTCLMCLMKHIL